ncbi:MAG: hypothetical protein WKH64_03320 [Chloroflexia bacterium]
MTHGHIEPPPEMEDWIESTFERTHVKSQDIVNVTNRWTLEGLLFNELRARRPPPRSQPPRRPSRWRRWDDLFCRR